MTNESSRLLEPDESVVEAGGRQPKRAIKMQRRTTSGNFDPYHKWLGLPPGKWMPTHFELLGLSIDEEEPSVITLAIKRQRDFMKGMRG